MIAENHIQENGKLHGNRGHMVGFVRQQDDFGNPSTKGAG